MVLMGKIMRAPSSIVLRENYSNSVRGPVFAADLAALRDDVISTAPGTLDDPLVAGLIFRAARLSRRVRDDVGGLHRAEDFLALDIMCVHMCGITVAEADHEERVRSLTGSRTVPAELGSMMGGRVVSGGLPTLGRRKR